MTQPLCYNDAQHVWETKSDGFVKVSNDHTFCTVCGGAFPTPIKAKELERATAMQGNADDMKKAGPLPGLGG